MKKYIELALILFLTCFTIMTVKASTPAEYNLTGQSEAKNNEVISYKVVVSFGTYFSSMAEYLVDYDTSHLQYVSFNSNYGIAFDTTNRKLIFQDPGLQVTVGQEIGTITFKVVNATVGSQITLENKKISVIAPTNTNTNNNTTNNNVTANNNTTATDTNTTVSSNNDNNDLKFYIVIGGMFVAIIGLLIYIISIKKKENDVVKF